MRTQLSRFLAPAVFAPTMIALLSIGVWVLPYGTIRVVVAILWVYFMALIISAVVHETGHIVGAKIAGLNIDKVYLGPLLLETQPDRRIHLKPNMRSIHRWAVQVAPYGSSAQYRKLFIFAIGGPLFSLIFGVGLMEWAETIPGDCQLTEIPSGMGSLHSAPPQIWALGCFPRNLGLVSVYLFVFSIAPAGLKSLLTDGAKIFDIITGARRLKRIDAFIQLRNAIEQSRRPKEFDTVVLEALVAVDDNTAQQFYGHYIAFLKSLDEAELETAKQHLTWMKTHFYAARNDSLKVSGASEIAVWEALHQDPIEGRRWFAIAKAASKQTASDECYAEGALLFAEGRFAEALEALESSRQLAQEKMSSFPGILAFYSDRIQYLVDRIHKQQSTQETS